MALVESARAQGSRHRLWHETFRVAAGSYESIYVNMPRFGLARATAHAPLGHFQNTARERITAEARHGIER